MNIKRLALVLALVAFIWFTSRWWIPWLLFLLPEPANKAEFIQSLDSLINIAGTIITVVMVIWGFILLKPKTSRQENESPIQKITLDELRERLGKYGSRVNWIDRGATDTEDLRTHGRIVISGRMKLGKTREAVELIRRAVEDDQVSENRLFEPSPVFRFFNREKLQEILKGVDPRAPILLFLDDFPHHYTGEALELLSDLLQALKNCKSVLVVATARIDQMTDEHRAWLTARKFHEVNLPGLNTEQASRLLDSATGVYNLQVDDQARTAFLEKQDGTPELTLIGLRKLHLQGVSQVTGEIARQAASESIVKAWADARRYIIENHPLAEYLFKSLATFYAARVRSYPYLVGEYAKHLWRSQKSQNVTWQVSVLKDTLTYLANFDIVERKEIIFAPDVVVENQISKDEALSQLGDFILRHRSLYRRPGLHRLYSHARLHAWALFDLGEVYFAKESYLFAKRFYSASINYYDHFGIYNNRGYTYFNLQDHPAALADFAKAIELNPQDGTAYNNRGLTYAKLQDHPAALADFAKAIELNPQDGTAYNNRGNTYYDLQDYPAALADFAKAIELNPQNAHYYNNRGGTYAQLQDYPAALTDYAKAIELNPQEVNAYNNRGSTYAQLQDYPAALADFAKAIELNPQNVDAYFNRGPTYYAMQNYPAALADFAKAIELNPQNIDAYNKRGPTYYAIQNYPAALADFAKAIELNPQNVDAYNKRGLTYYAMQNYPAALADFAKAIELNSQNANFYSARGITYYAMQNYPAALADFAKAIELNSQNANSYSARGLTYYAMQNYPAALADYAKAIELNPQDANSYSARGLTYAKLQDYLAALADYANAIELNPQDVNSYYNTACAFALQSQTELACTWLRQSIDLDAKYLDLAYTDRDFDPIRETPEFQSLFKGFKPRSDLPA